jgi:mono/diheme cytochrome c family protein
MRRVLGLVCAALSALLLMGAANGAWLNRVSPTDHLRVSPFTGNPDQMRTAASAGAQIYHNECAKCHGNDAMGIDGRPKLVSSRIADASDGDLFWIMNNGVPWRGMPPWNMLPAKQRWQLVAYLRALNSPDVDTQSPSKSAQPEGNSK